MRSRVCLALVALGLALCLAEEVSDQGNVPSVRLDGSRRPLTDVGYLRYGNPFLFFANLERNVQNAKPQNPTETNEIEQEEEEGKQYFLIRNSESFRNPSERSSSDVAPLIGIRRRRDVEAEIPESSKVGKLRKKRTYCRKCGGGGYGGGGYGGYGGYSYRPVAISVPVYSYPVYSYPVYSGGGGGGGGGKGCNVCGGHGGGGGGGGGGGFSGSYSQSSSSSHSSSGSWGYGK